jgi:hypothetical protein
VLTMNTQSASSPISGGPCASSSRDASTSTLPTILRGRAWRGSGRGQGSVCCIDDQADSGVGVDVGGDGGVGAGIDGWRVQSMEQACALSSSGGGSSIYAQDGLTVHALAKRGKVYRQSAEQSTELRLQSEPSSSSSASLPQPWQPQPQPQRRWLGPVGHCHTLLPRSRRGATMMTLARRPQPAAQLQEEEEGSREEEDNRASGAGLPPPGCAGSSRGRRGRGGGRGGGRGSGGNASASADLSSVRALLSGELSQAGRHAHAH